MRTRLLRGLAASILALTVILPGTAQPAQAADGVAIKLFDVLSALGRLRAGKASGADLKPFIQLAISAVTTSQNEVIKHIDAIVAAEVKAAADSASTEFTDIEGIIDDELGLEQWTRDVARAGRKGAGLLTLVDRPSAEQIAQAVIQLYQIALVGADFVGSRPYLIAVMREYVAANRQMIETLEPDCKWINTKTFPGGYQRDYRCVAANNVDEVTKSEQVIGGRYYLGPVNIDAVKLEAGQKSSWIVAKEYLPMLEQELRKLEEQQ
ncbi:hypothetical protein [Krasilnikovia sp. M28-CT-15]|uniref:hypothetical protein n=1 Tax=Krasilnikovia sp. M28-CT-15 TaxID=3373540 RepID=UPI0038764CB5